jgi:hypothetical protein
VGIRNFRPPKGARSTFTNPFLSRTFRLRRQVVSKVSTRGNSIEKNLPLPDRLHHAQAHRVEIIPDSYHRELRLHPTCRWLEQGACHTTLQRQIILSPVYL